MTNPARNGRTPKADAIFWQWVLLVAALVLTVAFIPIGNYGQMLGRWPFLLIATGLGVVAAVAGKRAQSGSPASWVLGWQLVIYGGFITRVFAGWEYLFYFFMFIMPIIAVVLVGVTLHRLRQGGEKTEQPYSLAEAEKGSIYHEPGSDGSEDASANWVQVGADAPAPSAPDASPSVPPAPVAGAQRSALGGAVGTLNALFWLLVVNAALQAIEVLAALIDGLTAGNSFLFAVFLLAIYSHVRSTRAGLSALASYLVYAAVVVNVVAALKPGLHLPMLLTLAGLCVALQVLGAVTARVIAVKAKAQLKGQDPKHVYHV